MTTRFFPRAEPPQASTFRKARAPAILTDALNSEPAPRKELDVFPRIQYGLRTTPLTRIKMGLLSAQFDKGGIVGKTLAMEFLPFDHVPRGACWRTRLKFLTHADLRDDAPSFHHAASRLAAQHRDGRFTHSQNTRLHGKAPHQVHQRLSSVPLPYVPKPGCAN